MKIVINFFLLFISIYSMSQSPVPYKDHIHVEKMLDIGDFGTDIAYDPLGDRLFYTLVTGEIYEIVNYDSEPSSVQIASASDHGITTQLAGGTIHEGVIYIVGSADDGDHVEGLVMKANLSEIPLNWETVAHTEPYLKSNSAFDHRMNYVIVSHDGTMLYLNSGSRTDHGEEYLGLREEPLTAKILQIPIASENLLLPNNNEELQPYVYAEGIRNTYGMAIDHEGELFGVENSGDRDHSEEINWLRKRAGDDLNHYGFPWTLGGLDNPQQFSDYDPGEPFNLGNWCEAGPSTDLFIQTQEGIGFGEGGCGVKSVGWVNGGFYNDPSFPSPPEGVTFREPILNVGRFGAHYRDESDFLIKRADTTNHEMYTMTSHLSPTGMVFDVEGEMPPDYLHHAFFGNFNSTGLMEIFNADSIGGAIMSMELTYVPDIDNYTAVMEPLVRNIGQPTDLVIVGNRLFVISYSSEGEGAIYTITINYETPDHFANEITETITIDGMGNENFWSDTPWNSIDNLLVDEVSGNENTIPEPSDFSGRFKVGYQGSSLFILAEITDDVIYTEPYNDELLPNQVFDYDVLELFIDVDNTGGIHTKTHNAFALHLSFDGVNVVDQCGCGDADDVGGGSASWDGILLNDMVDYAIVENGNDTYTWEVKIDIHHEEYDETRQDNEWNLVNLNEKRIIGFGVGYNDYDEADQRVLMSSFTVSGDNNGIYGEEGGRNVAWQDASVFGELFLLGSEPAFALSGDMVSFTQDFEIADPIQVVSPYTFEDFTFSLENDEVPFADIFLNSTTGQVDFNSILGAFGEGTMHVVADNGNISFRLPLHVFVNDAPDFTLTNQEVSEEETLAFQVNVNDSNVPDQTLNFSLDTESTELGMSINSSTGEFEWVADEDQDGTYGVIITVNDGIEEITEEIIIQVFEVNEPPQLQAVTNMETEIDVTVSFAVQASDADLPSQVLIFSLDQLSVNKGMSVDETGLFIWTPDEEDLGTHSVITSVSDGVIEEQVSFEITVIGDDSPLSISREKEVDFFPNPVTDHLIIQGANDLDRITIYSLSGKIIMGSPMKEMIDVSKLKQGVYLLEGRDVNAKTGFRTKIFKKDP